jgi:hypothetical protein
MAKAWSRQAAVLALSAALLIGGVSYGVVTHAQAPVGTPRTAEGKPDLAGIWVPSVRGGAASKYDEFGGETVFAARDNSFENFENDNALRRLGDRNKPRRCHLLLRRPPACCSPSCPGRRITRCRRSST